MVLNGGEYLSPKYFRLLVVILLVVCSLIACTIIIVKSKLDLENSNAYWWQKYMNEQEFNLLDEGISYIDVVTIAGGIEAEQHGTIYIWYDEILLTQAYEIQFKGNELISKKIIELKGYSTR